MHVRDLMTEKVIRCTPWVTAQAAANLMKNQRVGATRWLKNYANHGVPSHFYYWSALFNCVASRTLTRLRKA
jgi:hypothetical protein